MTYFKNTKDECTYAYIDRNKEIKLQIVQVIDYEIVVNFSISAITSHDIQQLSINLPEFTLFVQLMN